MGRPLDASPDAKECGPHVLRGSPCPRRRPGRPEGECFMKRPRHDSGNRRDRGPWPICASAASLKRPSARRGYHAGDVWDKPDIWGLPPKQKKIWLPAGIVVPWLIGSDLWRISIRRIGDTIGTEQRYVVVSGSGNTLFGVDTLMRSAGFGSMADARTPTSTSVSCVVPTRRSSPVL